MHILAIDTTGMAASVALVTEEKTVGAFTLNHEMTHSQSIMPLLEKMSEMLGFPLEQVDGIACSAGPGSFTGLRIGAATTKGLAYALQKKIAAVPTLDALAYNVFEANAVIVPVMDARRNQVYTATYRWENEVFCRLTEHMAEDMQTVLARVSVYGRAVFLGDGVSVHREAIVQNANFMLAPPHLNRQRAEAVGAYALAMVAEADWQTADAFMPVYLRPSQAEREAAERAEAAGGANK